MTYEMYRYVFLGGAALAGVMFCVSLVLFFVWRIPAVIRGLNTGRVKARKAPARAKTKAAMLAQDHRERMPSTKQLGHRNTPEVAVQVSPNVAPCEESSAFEIEYDITFIHTDERIG